LFKDEEQRAGSHAKSDSREEHSLSLRDKKLVLHNPQKNITLHVVSAKKNTTRGNGKISEFL
jgi:hypothetical protein